MSLHNKHYIRLFLISIGTIFYFLANIQRVAIPGAIFDLLQGDLGLCASKITLLGAIFCYTYAFCQLIVGLLVDKIGGFRTMAIGAVAFGVGAMLFPLSNNLALLYLSRALVGFGASTFYLSSIREVKKFAKDKNFSLAVSYILFVGYSGGIVANAPFVLWVNNVGWKEALFAIGGFTMTLAIIYLITLFIFHPIKCLAHTEEKTFSIKPFKEVLSNKNNVNLYIFGAVNYGLYYVLQSVIGKKFLQDFCLYDVNTSALVLSIMALISAFAGTITAFVSKTINNRRAIIFKTFSILSFLSVFSVCFCLFFEIHTKALALVFCVPSFIGSISPLLILTLHLINRYEISGTAVAIQNFSFFMMVGLLGMISGMIMNLFEPIKEGNVLIYSKEAYLAVFGLFLALSIIEIITAFKTKDNYN